MWERGAVVQGRGGDVDIGGTSCGSGVLLCKGAEGMLT